MNLDQVRVFLVVARLLHFSRAAEELYISQSAVSAQISKLESHVGVKLFHRIGRRVELTDAGRFLAREGAVLRDQADRLERHLLEFADLRRGVLSLGASFTVGNYWLPSRLRRFLDDHGAIEVSCSLDNAEGVLEGTGRGQFDLGFVSGSLRADSDGQLIREQVGRERLRLVVAPGHPWFGRQRIEAKELSASAWVVREQGSGAQQMFEAGLARLDRRLADLPVALVLNSSEMVRALVASGAGAGALPESMLTQDLRQGQLWPVEVDGLEMLQPIWMVRHKQREQTRLITAFEGSVRVAAEAARPEALNGPGT